MKPSITIADPIVAHQANGNTVIRIRATASFWMFTAKRTLVIVYNAKTLSVSARVE